MEGDRPSPTLANSRWCFSSASAHSWEISMRFSLRFAIDRHFAQSRPLELACGRCFRSLLEEWQRAKSNKVSRSSTFASGLPFQHSRNKQGLVSALPTGTRRIRGEPG